MHLTNTAKNKNWGGGAPPLGASIMFSIASISFMHAQNPDPSEAWRVDRARAGAIFRRNPSSETLFLEKTLGALSVDRVRALDLDPQSFVEIRVW